jgi:hypothetical protein
MHYRLAVRHGVDLRVAPHPSLQNAAAVVRREIAAASPAGMICVCVCNDGPRNGSPRVDMEIAALAK